LNLFSLMKNLLTAIFVSTAGFCVAQTTDEAVIKNLFNESLKSGKSYEMLRQLTQDIGPRLSGSAGADAAVEWSKTLMKTMDFDSVWLQPVMVPHWVRGQKETAFVTNSKKIRTDLVICALGGSVGTGPQGVSGKLIEVKTFDELKALGTKEIQGKIIFFNRPMDPVEVNVFNAYMGAVMQRAYGASEAAKYGAVGVIVRSMGLNSEDYPHTGGLRYVSGVAQIPAIAVSTNHADLLSKMLSQEKDLVLRFETHCETLADAPSFNVIGEIRGSEYADEIIVVGGHLDSWDLAQGAHDDGTGCVQAIETLRLFKATGYKPRRTIRAVMFMNEENGSKGGLKYAEVSAKNKEKHIAAIESDRGGFTPRGFAMKGATLAKAKVQAWRPLFEPYGLTDFSQEGAGADVEPLADQGALVLDFLPDGQRYFDYHHTPADTFDKVSKRELELGAAAIAALAFLVDKYGLH
jgi:carboxypeptidase Q